MEEEKMPWGRFKGEYISDLPSSYLKWVAENVKESNEVSRRIVQLCDEEFQFREKYNAHIED